MYPLWKPSSTLPASVLADLPVTRLLRVERDGNPLRRFGHVSPHIGKISPLDATALRGIAGLAASSLPPCPGPTLVVGMTESALLLSWFIAERLAARTGGDVDLRFTTREHRHASPNIAGNGACRTFLEPHSHGPVHSLELPAGLAYPRAVIVEDELTTGATLRNLLLAIRDAAPATTSSRSATDALPSRAGACTRRCAPSASNSRSWTSRAPATRCQHHPPTGIPTGTRLPSVIPSAVRLW